MNNLTLSQLIKYYNALTGRGIKKFRSKGVAISAVIQARAEAKSRGVDVDALKPKSTKKSVVEQPVKVIQLAKAFQPTPPKPKPLSIRDRVLMGYTEGKTAKEIVVALLEGGFLPPEKKWYVSWYLAKFRRDGIKEI